MKKILNLKDSNSIKTSRFSGGECHVKLLTNFNENDEIEILARINSADDLMYLLLANDALRQSGITSISAFIPYFPYARQDRVMVPGEPLSIKVFASIINSANFKKVSVYDAHSDVTPALLDRCIHIKNHDMVRHFIEKLQITDYLLVSPDLGAYKKTDKLAASLGYTDKIITGIKIRDLSTGNIIKSDINENNLQNKNCIVVDDICDGGRTFIELASVLKNKGANKLYLMISHGIFSHNAIENLIAAGYEVICCTNSVSDREESSFFHQFNLFN
ncbi:MAG: ribose-phosphate diphosphokinase [Bacteroidota bacterium]